VGPGPDLRHLIVHHRTAAVAVGGIALELDAEFSERLTKNVVRTGEPATFSSEAGLIVWQDQDVAELGGCAVVATTERLVVRPWRLDEADRFFDIYRRREVVRWIGAEPMQTRREAIEMIERGRARYKADSRFGSWAVIDRASGVPVGSVLLKPLPDGAGEIEIGWQLHPDSWGHGFATEGARAVVQRGFADGLPEVWAVMYPENERSAAVCRRIGMRLLGTTHRWYHEPQLMFWAGATPERTPTFEPDQPARSRRCEA
jgi:RimJ/RimL family protein N-acetyltransferase